MRRCLIVFLLLAAAIPLSAQFSIDSKGRGNKPILINSDAMDVDLENGKATFYGNVIVNDPQVIITCKKMILYQEPKKKQKDAAAGKKNTEKTANSPRKDGKEEKSDSLTGGAKLDRIECVEDVVITRKKVRDDDKNQWGTCGKAVYFHQKGTITMTEEPVLYQDDSKITGTRLTFFRDSNRIEGTEIKIEARDLNSERKKDGGKASAN